jgi:hypothetical protein
MLRCLFVVLLAALAACDYSFAPSEAPRTPEPTPNLEDEVADYVRTYGGAESQYRVILNLDDCDNLDNLLISTTTAMENEPEGSEEWRADLGYANAVNHRQLQLDC